MDIRLNQTNKAFNWDAFIDAINKMHGIGVPPPAYREFVKIHVAAMSAAGMSWQVHTMNMGGSVVDGVNFLTWHRWFLLQFQRRLQLVSPGITIPYWDVIADRTIPDPLQDPKLLKLWGVTRKWNPAKLPSAADLAAANKAATFDFFQRTIEGAFHAGVHNAVGGDMAGPSSPSDPLFWLHHANIDRIWAQWQTQHPEQAPSNMDYTLQPEPMFGVTVASVQDIAVLGYQYG